VCPDRGRANERLGRSGPSILRIPAAGRSSLITRVEEPVAPCRITGFGTWPRTVTRVAVGSDAAAPMAVQVPTVSTDSCPAPRNSSAGHFSPRPGSPGHARLLVPRRGQQRRDRKNSVYRTLSRMGGHPGDHPDSIRDVVVARHGLQSHFPRACSGVRHRGGRPPFPKTSGRVGIVRSHEYAHFTIPGAGNLSDSIVSLVPTSIQERVWPDQRRIHEASYPGGRPQHGATWSHCNSFQNLVRDARGLPPRDGPYSIDYFPSAYFSVQRSERGSRRGL
jgi:hypothetical protein